MSGRVIPRIAVLGSMNLDVVIHCSHLPTPGETVIAHSSREISGGKGANQAVAAARLGADVSMISRVGNDDAGKNLIENLRNDHIKTDTVFLPGSTSNDEPVSTGLAVVMVEQSGENSIVVVPGANGVVSKEDVDRAFDQIEKSDVLLVQLEIPLDTVLYACQRARQAGVRIILDPAPAPSEIPDHFFDVDLLCPNQSEASFLVGFPVDNMQNAQNAARELVKRGAKNAIITMGNQGAVLCQGAFLCQGESTEVVPAYSVEMIDSTAAGDAFAGALAIRWAEQNSLLEATRFACAAGALAASRRGAQPGMPTRNDVDLIMKQQVDRS